MDRMLQLLYGRGQPAASSEAATSSASLAAESSSAAASATETESGRRVASGNGGASGRDPESHRLIEKRRRDRVNGALAELCCLVPSARAKQSQGRIEKAEIIEMAIQHIVVLTSLVSQYKTESVGHQIPTLCAENFQQGFLDATRATLSFLAESNATQSAAGTADLLCAHLYTNLQAALQRYSSVEASAEEDSEISALMNRGGVSLPPHHPQPPQQPPPPPPPAPPPQLQSAYQATPKQDDSPPPRPAESDSIESDDIPDDDVGDLQLPGFVLHPNGTHYLPLVLPRTALGKELLCRGRGDSTDESGGSPRREHSTAVEVLHPVSIPVNFRSARQVIIVGRKRKRPTVECWDARAESD